MKNYCLVDHNKFGNNEVTQTRNNLCKTQELILKLFNCTRHYVAHFNLLKISEALIVFLKSINDFYD